MAGGKKLRAQKAAAAKNKQAQEKLSDPTTTMSPTANPQASAGEPTPTPQAMPWKEVDTARWGSSGNSAGVLAAVTTLCAGQTGSVQGPPPSRIDRVAAVTRRFPRLQKLFKLIEKHVMPKSGEEHKSLGKLLVKERDPQFALAYTGLLNYIYIGTKVFQTESDGTTDGLREKLADNFDDCNVIILTPAN